MRECLEGGWRSVGGFSRVWIQGQCLPGRFAGPYVRLAPVDSHITDGRVNPAPNDFIPSVRTQGYIHFA